MAENTKDAPIMLRQTCKLVVLYHGKYPTPNNCYNMYLRGIRRKS